MRVGLILGGGGEVGIAWEIGVLAALEKEAGFSAKACEVIAGTSAGAIVGAYVAQRHSVIELAALDHAGKGVRIGAGFGGKAEARPIIPQEIVAALMSTEGTLEQRGAMAVLPAGCGPAVRLATSCDVTVYGFAPKVLKSFREELDGPRPPELDYIAATCDGDLMALLHLLDRELGLGEPSGRLYADSLAFALLARAVALSSHHARTLSFDASPLNVRAQERLFEFIEENLHRNLGLEDLAIQVGYGRGHFLKTFRAAAGTSPHQYLLDRRVQRAKAMLKKTSTSLVEIATACGFSSQSHFSSEFRRRVGISPGHYRRIR